MNRKESVFRGLLAGLCLLISGASVLAQDYVLSGSVYNRVDEAEVLIGVHVVYGPAKGVVTDIDGHYQVELPKGEYTITFSYVGFESETIDVTLDRNTILDMGLKPLTIDEVVIVADVARSRETPVAFSTITPSKLQENLASQDIPMVLNSTPGVYATQEGGGDGDAQVTIRGFDSRNVGVLLDGVPVNDMENGHVYWSNWFGLDAVTRSIQVQRGLGASKLALPSVGGTINIITKGVSNRKEGSIKQEFGSEGYLRTSFGYNSGEMKNGWGVSVAGSYKRGNGWVDQTWTEGAFYYLKLDKKIGNHIISLSGYGAPQRHGQRAYQLPISVYDSAYAEKLGIRLAYGPEMSAADSLEVSQNRSKADEGIGRGLRFNQHWGYLTRTNEPGAEQEIITERVNQYHKPQFTLKDFWSISDRLYMSNIAYLSIGRGGGIREKSTTGPGPDGLKDFQSIYDRNIGPGTIAPLFSDSLHAASNYLRMLRNEHNWFGLLSTMNYRLNSNLSFSGGIDLRSYKGIHYEQVYDLLGADYVSPDHIVYDSVDWTDPYPLVGAMLFEGDKNNYHYEGLVRWGGMFFETEYKSADISAFLNVTSSLTAYKQINYLYDINPAIEMFENGYHYYPGFTVKGGMNYNMTDRMNAFINLGYLSKAPSMSNVFDFDNALYTDIENEMIRAIEGGYSYNSPYFSANLNAYYTNWANKPVRRTIPFEQSSDDEERFAVIRVMDAIHKGVELDFVLKVNRKLEFQGLVSLGDWRWNSRDSVDIIDNFRNVVDRTYYNAIGVHVGNSAQTQFAGEIRWEPIDDFYIKPRYTYFSRYFAQFDPASLFDEAIESWQVPSYGMLDLHTGYKFELRNGHIIQLRGNILNALNTTYVATAQNNDTYNGLSLQGFDARSASVFMGLGRRYTVSIGYLF
jgi:hypothetical protein